jgi:hypothetical protein
VFRKAAAGELPEDSGLCRLAALTDIDVGQVGVNGAANFFESKVRAKTMLGFITFFVLFKHGFSNLPCMSIKHRSCFCPIAHAFQFFLSLIDSKVYVERV